MNPYSTLAHPRVRVLAWQPGRVADSQCVYVSLRIDDWLVIRGIPVWDGRAGEPMFTWPANISLHDANLLAQVRTAIHGAYHSHIDAATLLMRK
jgi:hypothetical protein